jgi:hypothetical protein
VRKILKAVTISGSASSNPIYCKGKLFQKYENVIKMKNKPYPALLGGSYLFSEIKKRTLKSRETIPLRNVEDEQKILMAIYLTVPINFFLLINRLIFSLTGKHPSFLIVTNQLFLVIYNGWRISYRDCSSYDKCRGLKLRNGSLPLQILNGPNILNICGYNK